VSDNVIFISDTLKNTFEEVEHSLLELENLVETQALREEQLDHRFQLAMYKEKKLAEFEDFRSNNSYILFC
jgi:dysbindin